MIVKRFSASLLSHLFGALLNPKQAFAHHRQIAKLDQRIEQGGRRVPEILHADARHKAPVIQCLRCQIVVQTIQGIPPPLALIPYSWDNTLLKKKPSVVRLANDFRCNCHDQIFFWNTANHIAAGT